MFIDRMNVVSMTALPTLFRLAETVEQKSFSNLDEARQLKVRRTHGVVNKGHMIDWYLGSYLSSYSTGSKSTSNTHIK